MTFAAIDPAVLALGIALIAPIVTYLVAARKLSGRIKDSEATDLWAESRSIREWSSSQVDALNSQIRELKEQNKILSDDVFELKETIVELQRQNLSLTRTLKQLFDKEFNPEQDK